MAETKTQIAATAEEGGVSEGVLQEMERHPVWPMISRLPVTLAVSIPLSGLKVCMLLELRCGQTIRSGWAVTEDVPLKAGAVQIGCGEFEAVEGRMALRLTRFA